MPAFPGLVRQFLRHCFEQLDGDVLVQDLLELRRPKRLGDVSDELASNGLTMRQSSFFCWE